MLPDSVRNPLLLALALFSALMLLFSKLGRNREVMDKPTRAAVVQHRRVRACRCAGRAQRRSTWRRRCCPSRASCTRSTWTRASASCARSRVPLRSNDRTPNASSQGLAGEAISSALGGSVMCASAASAKPASVRIMRVHRPGATLVLLATSIRRAEPPAALSCSRVCAMKLHVDCATSAQLQQRRRTHAERGLAAAGRGALHCRVGRL